MTEAVELEACIVCGNPADTSVECWACEGKGTILPIGVYQPQMCKTCGGKGRIHYCKSHAAEHERLGRSRQKR